MGLFVNILIDKSKFSNLDDQKRLLNICPVDAVVVDDSGLFVDPEQEDECTFCDLCVQSAPADAIKIQKTYQQWLETVE